MTELTVDGKKIKIVEGNIALFDVEAIVNAANKSLKLGGGVAGAIRTFGGPAIQEECDRLSPIEVGQAVITGGGNLKARYVIHAVGPIQGEGHEDAKLAAATLSSLTIARDRMVGGIAFPAISTGIFGFPLQRCSEIMLQTAVDFLKKNDYPREIIFCLYGQEAFSVFEKTLEKLAC
ncbi:MAG: macro domain-containing protein [Clostridiales bacterium]|nr:macro domain-containing protein [Clostridiales bacterium]